MKIIFLFLTLIAVPQLHAAATVANTQVEAQVQRLKTIAEGGLITYDVNGNSLAELVISFADQTNTLVEDSEFVFDYTYLQFEDESAYGSTDAQTFSNLIFAAVHFMDDDAVSESEKVYSQQELTDLRDALQQLEKLAVIYSWNPNGNTVCGSMLTTPVIIDPATKKAYALDFYKISGC